MTNLNTAFNTVGLYINDFDVVSNDVYIVGYARNFPANGYNFGYWKNGVRTILNNNTPDFNPSYIKVLNNDVYTSINFPTQGYYINTTYHDTPNKTNNGLINYGNEMYVYGGFRSLAFTIIHPTILIQILVSLMMVVLQICLLIITTLITQITKQFIKMETH